MYVFYRFISPTLIVYVIAVVPTYIVKKLTSIENRILLKKYSNYYIAVNILKQIFDTSILNSALVIT